ncbi:hypothetical protein [Rouxiella badensis]|uniref:hypothetical protein n=1 Tax=Rouxiella badensis TaxID=1646377 RepID=UPI003C4F8DD1
MKELTLAANDEELNSVAGGANSLGELVHTVEENLVTLTAPVDAGVDAAEYIIATNL